MNTLISGFLRQAVVAIAALAVMTAIVGVAYPAVVWAASRIDSTAAEGSQVTDSAGCAAGSTLIGLDPQAADGEPDGYLHGRVLGDGDDAMAPGDPASSGGSNYGPNSTELADYIAQRRAVIAEREGVDPAQIPADALTGPSSGLDPHISPEYAALQVPRIAENTGKSEAEVRDIVETHTQGRQLGFLGQPRVNVLAVNLALGHTVCP